MTSRFLENVKIYSFKILHDYIWVIPPKFSVNYMLKNLTSNIFFVCLFHGLSFVILEKKIKKIGGHQTNYLSGGPNLTPSPTNFENVKECNFCHLYNMN